MQVRVDDVRLFFDVEGAGLDVVGPSMRQRPTLVLLHGGPGFDHTVFRPSYSQLADTAQVVYLDLRGHGRSDRGDPSRWTVDMWAENVRGFCAPTSSHHVIPIQERHQPCPFTPDPELGSTAAHIASHLLPQKQRGGPAEGAATMALAAAAAPAHHPPLNRESEGGPR